MVVPVIFRRVWLDYWFIPVILGKGDVRILFSQKIPFISWIGKRVTVGDAGKRVTSAFYFLCFLVAVDIHGKGSIQDILLNLKMSSFVAVRLTRFKLPLNAAHLD